MTITYEASSVVDYDSELRQRDQTQKNLSKQVFTYTHQYRIVDRGHVIKSLITLTILKTVDIQIHIWYVAEIFKYILEVRLM